MRRLPAIAAVAILATGSAMACASGRHMPPPGMPS